MFTKKSGKLLSAVVDLMSYAINVHIVKFASVNQKTNAQSAINKYFHKMIVKGKTLASQECA